MRMTFPPEKPTTNKHYIARILERRDFSEISGRSVSIRAGVSFKAGQYATLGVDHEGKRIERGIPLFLRRTRRLGVFPGVGAQGELTPKLYN